MQVVIRILSLLAFGLSGVGVVAAQATDEELRSIRPPQTLTAAIDAMRGGSFSNALKLAARDGPVALEIVEWMRLRGGGGGYRELQKFLARNPDWPGLTRMRIRNEGSVAVQGHGEILSFFNDKPARTVTGTLAHARALRATGSAKQADDLIVNLWRTRGLSTEEQSRILLANTDLLRPHHIARLEAMLWQKRHADVQRMIPLAPEGYEAFAEAWIGLQQLGGNVDALLEEVPDTLKDHAGLNHARMEWRIRKDRREAAKELMLKSSATAAGLGNPEAWANRRRQLARHELRNGSAARAYELAARNHLVTGSHFADLEWLAGYIALTRLGRPEVALSHFLNHDRAVSSVISQGRAGYWQGRAYQAMGDAAAAEAAFREGARYQTSFYGLLAAEELGLPFDVGLAELPEEDWRTRAFVDNSVFHAGLLLAASGERNLAEMFLTHLAESLSPEDAAHLGQAVVDIGEPHIAVRLGKVRAQTGNIVPVPYYALHPLAEAELPIATEMALAIARRESEYDPVVISGAGARGLMQLMPRTAREVAGKLGLASVHSNDRLLTDPVYNGVLGTAYLAELAGQFSGNVVMVSAGYNAGPSRPRRWMAQYGDPRGKGVHAMIDWIEGIPFRETRNYVMRVSESLPIYRARLGQDPLPQPFSAELQGRTLR